MILDRKHTVYKNLLVPLVYTLAIAGYPLVAFWETVIGGVDNTVLSIIMRAVLLGSSVLVIWNLGVRRKRFCTSWFAVAVFVFWTLYLTRMLADVLYAPERLRMPGYEYFLLAIGSTLVPALAANVYLSSNHLDASYRSVLGATTIAATGTLIAAQQALQTGDLTYITAGALNPISFGHLGATLALLSTYGIIRPSAVGVSRSLWHWMGMLILMLMGLVCLTLSAARGPFLGLIFGWMALLLMQTGSMHHRLRGIATITMVGVGGVTYAVSNYWMFIEGILLRFQSGLQLTGASASTRIDMYTEAWKDFQENPLLGNSIIEEVHMIYPHNMIFESFMAMGIVGGALSILIMILNVKNILILLRRHPEESWTSVLLIQYSVGAMVSGSIWGNSVFWLLTLAVGAIAQRSKME